MYKHLTKNIFFNGTCLQNNCLFFISSMLSLRICLSFKSPLINVIKNLTCCLIDDDLEDLEILRVTISKIKKSIHCLPFSSIIHALSILKLKEDILPDYIFLDINMALMDGKEAIVEIKKIPRLSTVPIVMYTISTSFSDIHETKKMGADYYFVKPRCLKFLEDKLDKLFSNQLETFLIKQN